MTCSTTRTSRAAMAARRTTNSAPTSRRCSSPSCGRSWAGEDAGWRAPCRSRTSPSLEHPMTVVVTHNEARKRFETTVEGHLCVADYQLRDNVMWMTHTGVPSAVGGRGIAAELVRVALRWAEEKGYRVEPS